MENTKVKEELIKEYPAFDLFKVICKNGASYNITKPKEIPKIEQEEILENKKFRKIGYHKTVRETHSKRKKKEV